VEGKTHRKATVSFAPNPVIMATRTGLKRKLRECGLSDGRTCSARQFDKEQCGRVPPAFKVGQSSPIQYRNDSLSILEIRLFSDRSQIFALLATFQTILNAVCALVQNYSTGS
jgi:hypothetical protein